MEVQRRAVKTSQLPCRCTRIYHCEKCRRYFYSLVCGDSA